MRGGVLVTLAPSRVLICAAAAGAAGLISVPAAPEEQSAQLDAERALAEARAEGRAPAGWLGVVLGGSASTAGASGARRGAKILEVVPGSPAAAAGLAPGDLIVEAARRPVADPGALAAILAPHGPGEEIPIVVVRDGQRGERTVTLGHRPGGTPLPRPDEARVAELEALIAAAESCPECVRAAEYERAQAEPLRTLAWESLARGAPEGPRAFLGVAMVEMTPELRRHFGADASAGVLVAQVRAGGPAAAAGIGVGDVLVAVEGDPVTEVAAVSEHLSGHEPGEQIRLKVIRDGGAREVELTLGSRPADAVAPMRLRIPGSGYEAIVLPERAKTMSPAQIDELRARIEALRARIDALARRLSEAEREATPAPR